MCLRPLRVKVQEARQAYLDALNESIEEDLLVHGKKPVVPQSSAYKEKEITQSAIDPGAVVWFETISLEVPSILITEGWIGAIISSLIHT
ncbi:hypothetical protein GCM10025791_04680 [Halioxenophilus aromaticivorans]|uniref:Uncharacterized protein n=1 Tax=Halioxenophilus aromaticivorans TaxID=1306992 RepID=A0AAV3TXW9_9ALTE